MTDLERILRGDEPRREQAPELDALVEPHNPAVHAEPDGPATSYLSIFWNSVKDVSKRAYAKIEPNKFYRYAVVGLMPYDFQKHYHNKLFPDDVEREMKKTFRISKFAEIGVGLFSSISSWIAFGSGAPFNMVYWTLYLDAFGIRPITQLIAGRRGYNLPTVGAFFTELPYQGIKGGANLVCSANQRLDSDQVIIEQRDYRSLISHCQTQKNDFFSDPRQEVILSHYLGKIADHEPGQVAFLINELKTKSPDQLRNFYSLSIHALKSEKKWFLKNRRASRSYDNIKTYFNGLLDQHPDLVAGYKSFAKRVSRRRDKFL